MSTAKSKGHIVGCDYCDAEYNTANSTYHEYCSKKCYFRDKGTRILNLLKYDHRFCQGDFSKLKEIERPTDEQLRNIQGKHSAESVVGFQYRTENAATGEITVRADVIDTVATGTVCANCGTTDHTDSFQRDFEPIEAAKRLRKRIQETRAEGQHEYQFDTKEFVEAWNENKDWAYALGRGLHHE